MTILIVVGEEKSCLNSRKYGNLNFDSTSTRREALFVVPEVSTKRNGFIGSEKVLLDGDMPGSTEGARVISPFYPVLDVTATVRPTKSIVPADRYPASAE